MPLLLVPLLVVLIVVALVPISLVLRYRAGTARRLARGWVATLNVAMLCLSVAFFLAGAAVTTVWVPAAFRYALAGLGSGCVLGLLGLVLTRWEASPRALYYTPNRLLVLVVTLVVTGRVAYGVWRSWHAWRAGGPDGSWLEASGAAGALAAGAVVLGYYVVYWIGVGRRARRHRLALVGRDGTGSSRARARRGW